MPRQQAKTPLGSRLTTAQRSLLAPQDRVELAQAPRRSGVLGRAIDWLVGPPQPDVKIIVNDPGEEIQPDDFRVQKEQYAAVPFSGWNGEMVQNAIDDADQGNFGTMELLYHAMMKEPRIGDALDRRAAQLLRLRRTMAMDNDAPPELIRLAGGLEKDFRYVLPDGELRNFVKRFIFFGFSLGPVDWTFRSNQQMPRAKCWTHSYIQWHWPKRMYFGQEENKQVWIPPEGDGKNWIVFTLGGERPWLEGAGRALANTWFNIIQTWDRWLELNDEFAEPLKGLKTPGLRRESPEVQKMWAVVSMLRGGDTVLLPEGYDLKYFQAAAQGYETFKSALLDVWYANVAIRLLGHNLAQYARAGSGARTGIQAGSDIAHEYTEGDARIAQDAWAPVGRVWVRAQTGYNDDQEYIDAGYDQPLEHYAPRLEIDTKPPEDQKQKSETQRASAQAMATFAKAVGPDVMSKLPIDYKASAEAAGWRMREDADQAEVTAEDVTATAKRREQRQAQQNQQGARAAA
jgi:hypothetical protein